MRIVISSTLVRGIVSHAAAEHPREACGLLLGRPGSIEEAVAATNIAEDPESAFEIDPALLLRIHREARGAALQLLGWYHSHPAGEPSPSVVDALRAVEDGRLWLFAAGGAVRGFVACAEGPLLGRFAPVDLLAVD